MPTLETLPPELQHKIHLTLLSDLDVSAVEGPLIHPDQTFWPTEDESPDKSQYVDLSDARWYILDPTILRHIAFYRAIFQHGGPIPWQRHVRFIFPSAIAMLDILTLWPTQTLTLIRRLKLLGHPIPLTSSKPLHAHHALSLLPSLQLHLLEYHDVYLTHDNGYGWGAVRKSLRALLGSPGWRNLQFFSRPPDFLAQDVRTLVAVAKELAWSRDERDFGFEMPRVPWVRAVYEEYVVGTEGREAGVEFGEQWVRGRLAGDGEVELQLVARRGRAARYVVDAAGAGDVAGMPPIAWRDLRRMGFVVGRERLDDPCGYL